jgi:hypothetical protein
VLEQPLATPFSGDTFNRQACRPVEHAPDFMVVKGPRQGWNALPADGGGAITEPR